MGLSYNPSIVVDGLQYALDVANPKCYSGSGNTTFDLTGRAVPGSLVNGPTYNSNLNGFFTFDGTNDYIDCGNFSDNLSNFTVAAWVKTTSSVMQMVVAKLVNYSSGAGWALFLHPTLGISIVLQTNGSVWIVYSSNKRINDNSWHYISAVINNKIVTAFYVDGISYPVTSQGQGTVTNYSNGINVRIARNEANEYIFQGDISQAHLYSKSLSAAEILQNYNANRGRYLYNADIATNGLILNLDPGNYLSYPGSGSVLYDVSGFGRTHTMTSIGYSSANNGTIQYTSSSYSSTSIGSSINVQGPWSLDCWLKYTSNNYQGTTIAISNGSSSVWQFAIRNNSGDIWTFGGTSQLTYPLPVVGAWNHYVLTLSSNVLKLYINGSLFASKSVTSQTGGVSDLVIGDYRANNSGNENYLGFIGPVKLYNRVITQSEVIQNYDAFRGRF